MRTAAACKKKIGVWRRGRGVGVGKGCHLGTFMPTAAACKKKAGGWGPLGWDGWARPKVMTREGLREVPSIQPCLLRRRPPLPAAAAAAGCAGFKATLLLEPKPQEPTKHQYDW